MQKKQKPAVFAVLGILTLLCIGTAAADVAGTINYILCKIVEVMYYLAAGVALIIIVLAGIKWSASGDDPKARKSSKESVIHAIIGLIIVILAGQLIGWVTTGTGITEINTGLAAVVTGNCVAPGNASTNTSTNTSTFVGGGGGDIDHL